MPPFCLGLISGFTENYLTEAVEVFDKVENSPAMQKPSISYQKKFSYAAELDWMDIMATVRKLYALIEKK